MLPSLLRSFSIMSFSINICKHFNFPNKIVYLWPTVVSISFLFLTLTMTIATWCVSLCDGKSVLRNGEFENLLINSDFEDLDRLNNNNCVCDGDCDWLGAAECPWGLTVDFCGCCLMCARGLGEPCGGAVGTCAQGLVCNYDGLEKESSEGTCSRKVDGKMCESPLVHFGCSFHDGKCLCVEQRICTPMETFLFPSEQACRSRITILSKTQESVNINSAVAAAA